MTVTILSVDHELEQLHPAAARAHRPEPLDASARRRASTRREHSADTAAILAFTTLSMMPALLFFLVAERRIVGGLSGAVKG